MSAQIKAVPVVRDACGNWSHPDLPDFNEDDTSAFAAWLVGQQIELLRVWMEDDAEELHERHCDGGVEAMVEWQPRAPAGADWFLLAICDNEDDGPVAHFARAITSAGAPQ